MTLPLRLRHLGAEPAHGALLRLCARNGRTVVSSFAGSLGLQLRAVLAGRDTARVAELAGLPVTEMARWSPVVSTADRIVSIAGEEISLGDWSVSGRRHCPDCLRSDVAAAETLGLPPAWFAGHRSWWDVRSIAACPEHGVALVDACPACSAPLGWRDARRLVCPRCRAALTGTSAGLDDPLGGYVAARLGVGRSERPAILDALPLRQAIRMCARLGRAGLDATASSSSAGVPELALGAEGFRRVVMGPDCLDDVLDRLFARRAADAPDGLGGAYGWLHDEWLGTDDPTAEPFRGALRRHAIARGVMAEDEDRLGATPPVPTINLTRAAAEAGVAIERMRQALDDVGAIPSGSRRGVAFALDPDVVRLVARRRGAVRRAAREMLGIGRTGLTGLARTGHLVTDDEIAFRRSAASLAASVERQVCAGTAPAGTMPMPAAAVATSVSLSRVIDALLQGCLPAWRSGDGVGLAGVLVRTVDLLPLRVRPDGLTRAAAARLLGVHQECVRALVRDGTLARGDDGMLPRAELDDFIATYVPGRDLALERGCSPAALVERLAEAGVHPAWPLATHRQAIFRRLDLPRPAGTLH